MGSPPGARAVAAIVTAPISIGVRAVGNAPEIVGRVRQELTLARFVGKMAVDQGRRELKRRLDGDTSAPVRPAGPPAAAAVAGVETAGTPTEPGDVPDAAELALEDYDQLPAAQIVAMLAGLTPSERRLIGRYEAANRHRRTVLGKLDQLGS